MTSAIQARNEAMRQVDNAANEEWKVAAELVVRAICAGLGFGKTFTTDLVWEKLEEHFPNVTTSEPKAMGPLMARMARAKIIEKTSDTEDSVRVKCHGRPLRLWKITTFSAN